MMRENVRLALMALARQDEGRLTADRVVESARPLTSPLHSEFEWNDGEAAHKYRIVQARKLIQSVTVKVHTTEYTMDAPVFVRDPNVDAKDQGYVSLARAAEDSSTAHEILVTEFGRASSALIRAKAVAAALGLGDELEDLIERLAGLRERAQRSGDDIHVSPN